MTPQVTSFLPILVLIVIAVILIFVVIPFFLRWTERIEAISLLVGAVGEYIGNPGLVWLGCGVAVLVCIGSVAVAVLVTLSLATCGTVHPVQLCSIVGR